MLHTYVALTRSQQWVASIDFADREAATACVAAEFAGWAPALTALITEGGTGLVPRVIHALPAGHRWRRVRSATLLGDAAHLAPPDGEGANSAMLDGAELGEAIAAHRGDINAAIAEYDDTMFIRSAKAAAQGAVTHALCFQDQNAPHGIVDFLQGSA